ncbi:hypothetical protein IJI28_01880 [Candidatus Saccharibacteria bacterium]|nr:hypothetical protein [Candidatus Saccharibacteria bacterium]
MKKTKKNHRRAGTVYLRVAKKCLDRECPAMPTSTKESILSRGDLHEIEKYVKVARIISVAVHEFKRIIRGYELNVPPTVFWNMLYAEDPGAALADFVTQLKRKQFLKEQKAKITFWMLKVIHDEWMEVHQDDFFDIKKIRQRCVFMPFELIGFERVMFYMIYIEDMLRVLDWDVDRNSLKSYYYQRQRDFEERNNLSVRWYGNDALVNYLMQAEYPVPGKIARVLRSDRSVAMRMAYS